MAKNILSINSALPQLQNNRIVEGGDSADSIMATLESEIDSYFPSQQLDIPREPPESSQSPATLADAPEAPGRFAALSVLIATFSRTPDPSKNKISKLTSQLKTQLDVNENGMNRLFEDAVELCESTSAVSPYYLEVFAFYSPWSIFMAAFKQTPHLPESRIKQLCDILPIKRSRICRILEDARDICSSSNVNSYGVLTTQMTTSSLNASSNLTMESIHHTESIPRSTGGSHPRKRKKQKQGSCNTSTSLAFGESKKRSRKRSDTSIEKREYPCLSCPPNSSKSTSETMEQWVLHQKRNHFPAEVFSCGLIVDQKPCNYAYKLINRRDNFKTHLRTKHGLTSTRELEDEASKRSLKVRGLYHDQCDFCSQPLVSRDQSMEHIAKHIENGARREEWQHTCSSPEHKIVPNEHFDLSLPDRVADNKRSDDKGDDDDDFDGGNSSGGGNNSANSGKGGFSNPGGSNAGGGSNANGSDYLPVFDYDPSYWKASDDHHIQDLEPHSLSIKAGKQSNPVGARGSLIPSRMLGAGAYGTVFEVINIETGRTYARKTFQRRKADLDSKQDLRAFQNEVRILKRLKALQDPHLVSFVGSTVQSDCLSILMEPVADIDLAHYLRKDKEMASLQYENRTKVLLQGILCLALALRSIHSIEIRHRDIKPANILIKNGTFLLTDFGTSSSQLSASPFTKDKVRLTPKYAAPEVVKQGSRTSAADVFSLGCVFLEMISVIAGKALSDFENFRLSGGSGKGSHPASKEPARKSKKPVKSKSRDRLYHAESLSSDKPYWTTLEQMYVWIDMLDKEQKSIESQKVACSISIQTIRKMISRHPQDRPTSLEVWSQCSKCSCSSDCNNIKVRTRLDRPNDYRVLLGSLEGSASNVKKMNQLAKTLDYRSSLNVYGKDNPVVVSDQESLRLAPTSTVSYQLLYFLQSKDEPSVVKLQLLGPSARRFSSSNAVTTTAIAPREAKDSALQDFKRCLPLRRCLKT